MSQPFVPTTLTVSARPGSTGALRWTAGARLSARDGGRRLELPDHRHRRQMAFDEIPEWEGFVDRLRAALPTAEFASAWAAGRAMSMTDAVALAMEGA